MDEYHDHDGAYGSDVSCVICRRNFFPEMETHEALVFDAIPMCRVCKNSVFENLVSNETPRDELERYPRVVMASRRSEGEAEDSFFREFSQLIRLARVGDGDRSLSRWRRVVSDNESEGFDQMEHLFTENGSNFSYGGYVGGSDGLMDREVFNARVRIADTDVDAMRAGLDPRNYEDEESGDHIEEEREVGALGVERETSERAVQERGGNFDFEEEGEDVDQISREIAETLDRTNPSASMERARESDAERIDIIAQEVGVIVDESEWRVSWEMSQEVGFEGEDVGEWNEESVREVRREDIAETETNYARVEWEEDSDDWEEELSLSSPGANGTRQILRTFRRVTGMGNSQDSWTIPQEDGIFNYSDLFSEMMEYQNTNKRNLEELLDHLAEAEGSSRRGVPPASSSFVENLPRLIFSEDQEKNLHLICAICKDPLLAGIGVIQLPCLHFYHSECILPWLSARNSCPLCRYELPTDDLDYEQGKSQYLAITAMESQPVTAMELQPITAMELQPVTAVELQPVTAMDLQPITATELQPVTAVELQPVEVSIEESNELEAEKEAPESADGSSGGDGGRWIFLAAAAPIVGIVGAVLVLWLGKGERRMGIRGSWGGQLREVHCLPSSDFAPANGAQRNRRWWPFF